MNHASDGASKAARARKRGKDMKANAPAETNWRRHAGRLAVTSVVAAAAGFIAIQVTAMVKRSAQKRKAWKSMDSRLELSLEHAGNTSEPTAHY